MALDNDGRQNFRDLLAGYRNLHCAAFDALWINGNDLRGLRLTRWKRALNGLVPATTTIVSQWFSIEERGPTVWVMLAKIATELSPLEAGA